MPPTRPAPETLSPEIVVGTVGYESITVAATAIGFTPSIYRLLQMGGTVVCRLETAQVRFRADGTDPTSSEGTPLEIGDAIEVKGHSDIGRFKAIRTGSTSGVLKCHFVQGAS